MSKAIEAILSYTHLLKFIEAVRNGVPNPLPGPFTQSTEKTEGNTALLSRVYGQRQLATRIEYGAPHVQRPRKKVDTVPVILPAFGDEITFDPSVLIKLRSLDAYTLDMGKQIVANDTKFLVTAYENNRIAMATSVLVNGVIWFGSDNRVLPSSVGATLTIDMGVKAGHKTKLNVFGSGNLLHDWSDPTVDIPGDIRAIKQASLLETGYEAEEILYGINIPKYITQNNYVKDYLSRTGSKPSGSKGDEYLGDGEIPQGLFGMNWTQVYTAFFEDSTETNQLQVSANQITFMPKFSPDWYHVVEGSTLVPTTIDIQTDAVAALNSMRLAHGMYLYGQVQLTPAAIRMFHGDVVLQYLKNPDAVFLGTAN
jgi:hypothetical protein